LRVDEFVSIRTADRVTHPVQTFDGFFAEVWPWAFRLASFLTHDTEAGEDVAQDVLVTMSQRWGSYDRPAAYLRTSIVNASYNWNRQRKTARSKLPMLTSSDEQRQGFDELADAIARLPFRQRAVLVLRYYARLSEAEIADALDCRPGTVKSLASRALATLAKEIDR
jgi:RNA polymerase sigma factor (sigma-70 family)